VNILQIGTCDIQGGAAKVSYRLHQEYKKRGHNSKLVVGYKLSSDPDVALLGLNRYLRAAQEIVERHTGFCSYMPTHKRKEFKNADIVNLHNLHGNFFNINDIRVMSRSKPVVWTLHDEWAITGHCACAFDCRKWRTGCGKCPRPEIYPAIKKEISGEIWKNKEALYQNSEMIVVTPSRWLKKEVEESMLSRFESFCIPNGIDETVFKPTNRKEARMELGLPQDKRILAFNAVDQSDKFKGFSFLVDALNDFCPKQETAILVLGNSAAIPLKSGMFEVINSGYIKDESLLAKYYSAADLFVLPSLSENFPLVALEAMSCGLPVAAFKIGGTPEAVRHMKTGYIADYKNSSDLARGMSLFLENETLHREAGEAARKLVMNEYRLSAQAEHYLELYDYAITKLRPN